DMHLIDVDEEDLPVTDPGEQLQLFLDVSGAFFRLGLAQQLLDLLPRQVGPPQQAADGAAAGEKTERLEDPLLELLHRPAVAGQAVLCRVGGFNGGDNLLGLLWGKRGARPPEWR